mmetsp:Transcript_19273/g.22950  ORF Transcript_19273/g.22950 Transcript_19273/m.22950 type:complete len:316 (+) Transcript_19273:121-1068(+)
MEASNATEDPFMTNLESGGGMEPLHAADAARRLLSDGSDIDEMETAPFAVLGGTADEESMAPVLGGNTSSGIFDDNGSRSALSNSLFERIQQQKNQQGSSGQPLVNSSTQPNPSASNTEEPFGYPMTEDVNYSFAEQPSTQSQVEVNVPQYSSTRRPDPYDTGGTDYTSTLMGVVSSVGSVASIAAKGAVSGTKYLYGNVVSNRKTSSAVGSTSGGRMGEMDYQRESLLMDPHDLEDRALPFSASPPLVTPKTTGMIGGLDEGSNTDLARNQGYSMVGYAQQFLVDVKDLFLAAPRYVQCLVVGLSILILWLLFS